MPTMRRQKILVVLGQTATGKSALAVYLARRFGGEVVSADSRQVYKGLDIGTGKITKREMRGVPHHLLDVADPRQLYNVAQFKHAAAQSIRHIVQKGKLPIVCGGTGFYIQALVDNIVLPEVKPNLKLRKRLLKKGVNELFKILKEVDQRRAKEIDRNNPRRLVRAIEIATALGKVPHLEVKPPSYEVLKIGLTLPDKKLKQKIHMRLFARISRGMLAEAKRLHRPPAGGGLSWKRMEELGLEYKYLAKYLKGELTKKQLTNQLETKIWHYAKRQMTWFKRDKKIKWFDVSKKDYLLKIESLIRRYLENA